jgi:hypothetical protein
MLRKDPDDAKLTIIYTGPSRRDMEAALNVAKMMRLNSVIREFEDWLREDDEIAKFMKTAEFNGALFAIEEALNDEQELLAVQLMLHCSPSYSDIELALEMAERRSRFVAVNNFIVWLELNKARKYYTQ